MNLKINSIIVALAILAVAPLAAMAATPFAGEDFDGGTTNGGFTSVTQVFAPDNSGSANAGQWAGGSFFDRFGILNRSVAVPFDLLDDSTTFPTDTMGILDSTKLDNVVVLADTNNTQNPTGIVNATWTFDISGRSNIELGIDFAMVGDFDTDDDFSFSYSIDGGASTTAFDIQIDETDTGFGLSDSGIFYGINLESGAFVDRYSFPFFDENEWLDITTNGETPGVLLFHPRDDGTNGDTVAQDGLVPVESLGGTIEERAYREINGFGDFNQAENEAYKDPLFVNPTVAPTATDNNFNTGIQLTNDFQTLTVPVSGTGTTLTLEFTGFTNSNQEFFVFDNILLSEAAGGIVGDFDNDGDVDGDDFGVFVGMFGNNNGGPPFDIADFDEDGDVDGDDFGVFVGQFGTGVPSTTIPEPSTLLLVTLAAGLGFARRR